MGLTQLQKSAMQTAIFFCFLLATPLLAADPAENYTEVDEAEFRQGGIGQQLVASGYPASLYGGAGNAYQQYATGTGGAGYVNMLRNLYRPPSLGLTDKVKHWVKSFMNRRQYVKPYYGAPGLQYSADEFGASSKPVMVSGGGYKAISVPLRQLQKYYKPYYGGESAAQFLQQSQQPSSGASASSSILSYNSPGSNSGGSGLYASETANAGHFSGGSSGLFGTGGSSAGLFNSGSSSGGLFGTGGNSGGLFSSSSDGTSALFAAANGGSSGSNLFAGSNGGLYSSGGSSSSNLFSSAGDGGASALFGAGGLSGVYGSSGGNAAGLYHPSSAGSSSGGSSVFSLDGSSNSGLFGSDGSNSPSFYGGSSGGNYGSRAAAASSLLSSLSQSSGSQFGDLYASGASPAATVYNPSSGDHQGRGYNKKQQQPSYGASNSALYVSSSSDSMRNPESYPMKSSQDGQVNSFNMDSTRNSPAEASYSVSFQPAQGKSYSAQYENSGFQPVSFAAEDGFKGKSS